LPTGNAARQTYKRHAATSRGVFLFPAETTRNDAYRPDALRDPRHRILPHRHLDSPYNGRCAARRIVCASKRLFRLSPDFQHIKTTTRDPRD